MQTFEKIINACFEKGFTDLHMTGGEPLVCRRDGEIFFQPQHILTPQYVDNLVQLLLNQRQRQQLRELWSTDLALSIAGKRLRINAFSAHRGVSLAIRFLPGSIPDVASLNLHPSLKDFCREPSGLLLICGSTGSGKTTTIAALINEINSSRACHVVTLEDPIEYLFASRKSFIEQRELGKHFHTYQSGLLDVLRQAPDVIVVGEMRSPETIQLSLDAAESGHLVIATMHAGSHEEALHRLCNTAQASSEHIRLQLSLSLVGIINQQLAYQPKLGYSVPLLSLLRNTKAISNLIRENKLSQIESVMETSKGKGMFTFESYREEYLATRKTYCPPLTRTAQQATGAAPQERASAVFNYDARCELQVDGRIRGLPDPAAAQRASQWPPERSTERLENAARFADKDADIDGYISQLEQRSS